MKVLAAGSFLLLAVHLASSLAADQGNSSEAKDSRVSKFQQILERIDDLYTWMTGQKSFLKPHYQADNSANFQLMMLTNKISTVEAQLQTTWVEMQATQAELKSTKAELKSTKAKLQTTSNDMEFLKGKVPSYSSSISSSFVRWGRKTCPGNTSLVYSGVAGGKSYKQKGSGTNRLCLSRQPQFDKSYSAQPNGYGEIYGAEYYHIPGHGVHDVPCCVCLAQQSSTIVIPGTMTCPPAWTLQYIGHIASEQHSVYHASEYVCLDQEAEDDSSGVQNQDGNHFGYTMTRCGSLPCPPYVNDKALTCVVCSK